MSLWLDETELITLTGFIQRRRQVKALVELGVAFRTRPADGFPLVQRSEFDKRSGRSSNQPRFSEIEA